MTTTSTDSAELLENAFVEGYRQGMVRAVLRKLDFSEPEIASILYAVALKEAFDAVPLPKPALVDWEGYPVDEKAMRELMYKSPKPAIEAGEDRR